MALALLLKCPQQLPVASSKVHTPCSVGTGPSDLALGPLLCYILGPPWAALQAVFISQVELDLLHVKTRELKPALSWVSKEN